MPEVTWWDVSQAVQAVVNCRLVERAALDDAVAVLRMAAAAASRLNFRCIIVVVECSCLIYHQSSTASSAILEYYESVFLRQQVVITTGMQGKYVQIVKQIVKQITDRETNHPADNLGNVQFTLSTVESVILFKCAPRVTGTPSLVTSSEQSSEQQSF